MESDKMRAFMLWGTEFASGGPEIDVGGPCQKPFINVTFWANFLSSRSGKTRFGTENSDSNGIIVIFLVFQESVWSWEAQKP